MIFEFKDKTKVHTELIIINSEKEQKQVKEKYSELVKRFPGIANELIKQLSDNKFEYNRAIELNESNHTIKLLEAENKILTLTHKIEILELKAKILLLEQK